MKKNIILTIITIFLISACTQAKKIDTSGFDGGVFKSADKGNTWQQRTLIPTTTGQPRRFSSVNAVIMKMDPKDNKAIYFGSIGNGLLYTLDGGGSWEQAVKLGNVTVRSIAIDPKDSCTLFVTVGNRVYKTSECTRSWKSVYYDNDKSISIDAVAINHYNSQNVFIGNSRGDIIKSVDGGESWHTIHRINGALIRDIVINPNDSRVMYIFTTNKGVIKTEDGGQTWDDKSINKVLGENKLTKEIKGISFVKDDASVIYIATKYGLIRSNDKGRTWEKINLIPPERDATIYTIAINQRNAKEIYYATKTTFFRSIDGGANWSTIKLPSSRAGWQILIDPKETNVIYLGVRALEK